DENQISTPRPRRPGAEEGEASAIRVLGICERAISFQKAPKPGAQPRSGAQRLRLQQVEDGFLDLVAFKSNHCNQYTCFNRRRQPFVANPSPVGPGLVPTTVELNLGFQIGIQ